MSAAIGLLNVSATPVANFPCVNSCIPEISGGKASELLYKVTVNDPGELAITVGELAEADAGTADRYTGTGGFATTVDSIGMVTVALETPAGIVTDSTTVENAGLGADSAAKFGTEVAVTFTVNG